MSSNEEVSFCNCGLLLSSWKFIFNCSSVYFLEYIIQVAFASSSLKEHELLHFPYAFPFFNLMYQIGVFLSRSSLILFQFSHVWILTLFQTFLFTFWFVQCFIKIFSFYYLLPIMFCVGLCGGFSYVNVFHLIMTENTHSQSQKEIVTSWNSFFISIGICLAQVFNEVADLTFFSKYKKVCWNFFNVYYVFLHRPTFFRPKERKYFEFSKYQK